MTKVGADVLVAHMGLTTKVVGFFGASSIERLPTEQAITARVSEFKKIGREEI